MPASALFSGEDLDGPVVTQGLGLAQELGLHGVPTRSLVEFEGGGSMLSREVLGEMLAVNEHGALSQRGGVEKSASSDGTNRRSKTHRGGRTSRRWPQGSDGGAIEERKQSRLLCQADALKWLRGPTSTPPHAHVRCPSVDARTSTKRGFKGREAGHVEQRRVVTHTDGDGGNFQASTSSTRREAPSPNKRRRHKLYDHDHNPRVLRKLVDDTVITGIAGAGALKTEEGKQMEALKLQLRLVCHRATELEDQIFQSQTGAPHRELLGELQLDRRGNTVVPLLERQRGKENNINTISKIQGVEEPARVDIFKQRRAPTQKKREPLDVSFSIPKTLGPQYHRGGNSGSSGVSSNVKTGNFQWKASMPEVLHTCHPLPSPTRMPTASLRRYLSSLRPFSADSARAAWGLADRASDSGFAGPGADRRLYNGDTGDRFDSGQPRWPVLFVMGSSKPPPTRHPLGVHALPLFDDDMVNMIAAAAGEPVEVIRAMTKVLSRFNFRLLQSAVTRICSAHAREEACASLVAHGGRRHRPKRNGAPGQATQAWGRTTEGEGPSPGAATAAVVGAVELSQRVKWQVEGDDEPLIMSEATAERALTAGFLSGVFGEAAVRDIVASSRPVVVFDSTETTEAKTREGDPAEEEVSSAKMRKESEYRPVDGTDPNRACNTGEDAGGRKGRAESAAACEDQLALPSRIDPGQTSSSSEAGNDPSEACNSPGVLSPRADGGMLHGDSPQQEARRFSGPGKDMAAVSSDYAREDQEDQGVLVVQLVRAAAARFRVHSLAVRHRDGGDTDRVASSSVFSSSTRRSGLDGERFGKGLFIGGSGGSGWAEGDSWQVQRLRRPASADSDELGLPPLKLARKVGRSGRPIKAGGRREEEEADVDVFGVPRPRSTPRCLRPGYEVFLRGLAFFWGFSTTVLSRLYEHMYRCTRFSVYFLVQDCLTVRN